MKVITIGRSEDNDKVVYDPYASGHHLQIIQHDDGHFSLSDFGSTNGTFVNGRKISGNVVLNDMDIVRIGNTTIPWRMYFEETDNPDEDYQPHFKENDNQEGEYQPKPNISELVTKDRYSDAVRSCGWIKNMKNKQKIYTIFFIAYIAAAVVLLFVDPANDKELFLLFNIVSIIGAIMVFCSILQKAKLDNQPVSVSQPNGDVPSSLGTFFSIGQRFLDAFRFRKIDDTYVSYTFLWILIPLFPTGCYRVEDVDSAFFSLNNEWKFYGSEKKSSSEISCIYLAIYGLLIWIIPIPMIIMSFM